MKRSALSVLLVVALTCHLPCTAQAQAKRSWTDSAEATRWLASDALTFALDVYEILQEATTKEGTLYLAQADDMAAPEDDIVTAEGDKGFDSDADTSGCGWTCYPSDYGCFSYDYAYRSPARLSADDESASDDESSSADQTVSEDTSLIELDEDVYPCMGNGDFSNEYAILLEESLYEKAADALHMVFKEITSLAVAQRARGEALMRRVGDCIAQASQEGLIWIAEQAAPQLATGQELLIRPLMDIDPSLPAASTLEFAQGAQPDYEWQVALDYFSEYGCPGGVWDQQIDSATVVTHYSPGLLNYWTARLAAQATINVVSNSAWVNTANDAIAALRVRHSKMIASIEPAVPEIPLQEFMFDNSTYVTIHTENDEPVRVVSGASVRSLSQAVLNAVRQPWTAQAAARVESNSRTR